MSSDGCALLGRGAAADGIRSLDADSSTDLDQLGSAALLPMDQLFQGQKQGDHSAADPSAGVQDRVTAIGTGVRSCRPDTNVTRRRQKEELMYLRERAAELEQELALLKAQRSGDAVDAADAIAAPSTWERIAARQREARRNAEKENDQLRCELEAQLRLARNLERLLRKRPSLGTMDERLFKRVCDAIEQDEDATAYGLLMERINQGYAVYREVLSAVGLFTAPADHRETKLLVLSGARSAGVPDANDLLCVQLTDVTVMPFSVEATSSAAWRCITSGYMQLQHQLYRGFDPLEDILALQYSITMARRRLRVDVTARAAMRWFSINDNGDVLFVWESQATPNGAQEATNSEESSASNSDGRPRNPSVQVRERGWTLFTAAEGDALTPKTHMLTCMQMIPLVASGDEKDQRQQSREVGVLTDLALEYFDQQIDHAHHAIETLLLNKS